MGKKFLTTDGRDETDKGGASEEIRGIVSSRRSSQ
jgi:hypothetical protein